jgi:hypothetical protein
MELLQTNNQQQEQEDNNAHQEKKRKTYGDGQYEHVRASLFSFKG